MIRTLRKVDGEGERECVLYLEGGGGGEETSGEVSAYESGGCNAWKNPKRRGSPTLRNIVCLEIERDDLKGNEDK